MRKYMKKCVSVLLAVLLGPGLQTAAVPDGVVSIAIPAAAESAGALTRPCALSGCGEKQTPVILALFPDENTPRLIVSAVRGRQGGRVGVTVEIKSNPGIIATRLTVDYDRTQMRLVEVIDGGLLGSGTFLSGSNMEIVPYGLIWEDAFAAENHTGNGVLVTLIFEIGEGADLGHIPVGIICDSGSTCNIDLKRVEFAVINGGVEVVGRTPGDADGDGNVNLTDVILIRRWLAGGYGVEIDAMNSDVNGDGTVDLKDVVLIRRYIAGGYGAELI